MIHDQDYVVTITQEISNRLTGHSSGNTIRNDILS